MKEQVLEIKEVQSGENTYNNIMIKTRYAWNMGKKQFEFDDNGDKIIKEQGIKPEHYVIVEKIYAEGKEFEGKYGKSYSCGVKYKGKDCSFWLPELQHKEFAKAGGIGDKVKISCTLVEKLNKKLGVKVPVEVLKFEVQ
jgi:hypothetical protein